VTAVGRVDRREVGPFFCRWARFWREVGPFIEVEIFLEDLLVSSFIRDFLVGREVGLFPCYFTSLLFGLEEKLVCFLVVWEVLLISFVSG